MRYFIILLLLTITVYASDSLQVNSISDTSKMQTVVVNNNFVSRIRFGESTWYSFHGYSFNNVTSYAIYCNGKMRASQQSGTLHCSGQWVITLTELN
jgi:hypothetical protein